MNQTPLRALLAALAVATASQAGNLRFVSWNIESGGNSPSTIAEQLVELGRFDAYCLQEVAPSNFGRYFYAIREAHGQQHHYIASSMGRGDRLMIVFNSQRLELIEAREMFKHEQYTLNDWRHRSPLALWLRDKTDGAEFFLMTVHLARGNADLRHEQAVGLREWATAQTVPAIAIGDFNFDYEFSTEQGNPAFEAFTADGSPWRWLRPKKLVDTNWSDRDEDGVDDYPGSMLDFAFVATPDGQPLRASSKVIVRRDDFPDDENTSDHRPVSVTVEVTKRRGTR